MDKDGLTCCSVEDCVAGILRNATSGVCYGSRLHEIHGLVMEFGLYDLMPHCVNLRLGHLFGKVLSMKRQDYSKKK